MRAKTAFRRRFESFLRRRRRILPPSNSLVGVDLLHRPPRCLVRGVGDTACTRVAVMIERASVDTTHLPIELCRVERPENFRSPFVEHRVGRRCTIRGPSLFEAEREHRDQDRQDKSELVQSNRRQAGTKDEP